MLVRPLFAAALLAVATTGSAQDCEAQLLVSGYNSDNVHIFNACNGNQIRNLDGGNRLDGAQAVREHDGMLYVASEENGRIVRYSATTFEFIDIFLQTGDVGVSLPTALAISDAGDVFVGDFRSSRVARVNGQTGALIATYELGGLIGGLDAGMIIDQQNRLLVPGFDTDNIAAIDIDSGAISEFAADIPRLRAPRVIVEDRPRNRFLVTNWRSGQVLALDDEGEFIGTLATVANPSGLVVESSGNFLVTSTSQPRVDRFDPAGAFIETVVASANSSADAATFLALLGDSGPAGPVDMPVTTAAEQAWLIGVGDIESNALIAELVITDGTAFGGAFDPSTVRRLPWGHATFALTDCDSGEFSWESIDMRYASGSYSMARVAPNEAQLDCEANGASASSLAGTWFGGAARNGEGIAIDVLAGSQGVMTWYTYRLTEEAR